MNESEPIRSFAATLDIPNLNLTEPFDIQNGISPAEGEVVALFYNASLRRARLEAKAALGLIEYADLWEDPEFGFDGAEVLSASSPFEFGLMANVTIPISGRLAIQKERASLEYQATRSALIDAEWNVRHQVRTGWVDWIAAKQNVGVLKDAVAQIEFIIEIADKLEAAGELSHAKTRLFHIERARRLAAQTAAQQDADRLQRTLHQLMGIAPTADVDLEDTGVPYQVQSNDAILLITQNTSIAAARAAYHVAEASLRLEIQKQYPDIAIGAGYGSEGNDDRLLLGLAVSLPILNANQASIAEAHAAREIARANVEIMYETLLHKHANARADQNAAMKRRQQFESTVLPLLDEQQVEIERLADLGVIDALLLLETLTSQIDAKMQLIELHRAEQRAAISLHALQGQQDVWPAFENQTPHTTERHTGKDDAS